VKYELKVLKNHNWAESYPQPANYVFMVEETGTYNVTIQFNENTYEVGVITKKTGDAVIGEKTWTVAGFGVILGKEWDPKATENDMIKQEDNVTYILTKSGNEYSKKVEEIAKEEGAECMVIAAKTEEDIASLETYEDKQMFLEELGLEESGVNRLIKKAYALLNLETFITAGEMEVKAWTYHKGWKAPQCAGVIHTDFEKGFIRAEVIKYDDYIQYGSEAAVREAGKLGIEGKEYVVQDGDIMHFRFNV
jgi:hypothetical protein